MKRLFMFLILCFLIMPCNVFAVKSDDFYENKTEIKENMTITGYVYVNKTRMSWGKNPTYMNTVYLLKDKNDFTKKIPELHAEVRLLGLNGDTEKVLKVCKVKEKCTITGILEIDSDGNKVFNKVTSVESQSVTKVKRTGFIDCYDHGCILSVSNENSIYLGEYKNIPKSVRKCIDSSDGDRITLIGVLHENGTSVEFDPKTLECIHK